MLPFFLLKNHKNLYFSGVAKDMEGLWICEEGKIL